jgi:hypothetical protein
MPSARTLSLLWRSAKIALRVVWRVVRQVFHEATGALFGIFAVYGLLLAWRQWKNRPVLWLVGFAVVYALMMGAFAFGAFRRARRIR